MTKNLLTITADREEWITGLSGKLKLGDFSGRGEGWFNNSEIEKFCVSLIQMFTTMEGEIELIGSEQNSDGSEYLETFALRVYVLSSSKLNGIVGIHCTLAERTSGSDCRKEEIRKMSGEVQIRNQHIKTFAEDLQKLMNGEVNEVTLIIDLQIL